QMQGCYEKYIDENLVYYFPHADKDFIIIQQNLGGLMNKRAVQENKKIIINDIIRNPVIQCMLNIKSIDSDKYYSNKISVEIEFFLPSGCYATIAIPQFISQLIPYEAKVVNF